MTGYDIVGDVHGCADKLKGLLGELGYSSHNGVYSYEGNDDRQAIFVGDLIDRGHQQIETLEIVRAMVKAGSAQVVMGNHEFNAISYSVLNKEIPGEYMRPHSDKNREQHRKFVDQVQVHPGRYAEYIEWFRTLPLWLDLDQIRVVHACWNDGEIERVRKSIPQGAPMSDDFVMRSNQKGSPEHRAIETLLKGPELDLKKYGQRSFRDKDGHLRHEARIRWWNARAETLRELVEIPPRASTQNGRPYGKLPKTKCVAGAIYDYHDNTPVFYGHYWRKWAPKHGQDWTANSVCVDFSAVKKGPLVAYRWSSGEEISPDHYVAYPSE